MTVGGIGRRWGWFVCKKGTSVETIKRISRDTYLAGISNLFMIIFGLPSGTEEDFRYTLDLLNDLDEYIDDFKCSSFQLFDGTGVAAGAKNFGLKVTGRESLFVTEYGGVGSSRLFYKEIGSDMRERTPYGPLEISQLERRMAWMRKPSVLSHLCCEHYLLYVCQRGSKVIASDV